ncbi:hypothetical protein G6F62_009004 [Rhizopus arrhizus]|nr:hypothetical protein G6F23_003520 [Rhizopus arrhizus]KAG0800438.1 hypothetical protein G6F22_002230 [Rhizopus arrhizus]KAG1237890.1 hypothetical protein G6F35_000545 [Rhizopus arrhizus]KAG1324602.1 hypothetical protein G6F62_009004 [Rhizopus arrhizus]
MCHYAIKPLPLLAKSVKYVTAESPTSVTFECIICLNLFNTNESYHTSDCIHSSCRQCLRDYFNSLLKDSNLINFDAVNCPHPDCKKQFHTEQDLELIFKPEEIKEWWETAYKITFMKNKVTCPFKDCGVSFEVEEDLLKECTFASCLVCRKGFCTACQSTWHPGVVKIVNEKEQLYKTLQVVKNNAWTRCPKSVIVAEAYETIILVSIIAMASQKKS